MSATDLDMRLGNWTLRNGRRSEELQPSCLFPWSESPGHPQGAPVGGQGWNKVLSWGREDRVEDLCDWSTTVEEGEGRLLQGLCCRTGDETGGLDLERGEDL